MKTITIRGIDPELEKIIKESAHKKGKSINQFILNLLKSALGVSAQKKFQTYHDLDELAGGWTVKDEKQFYNVTKPFDEIDREMWE